jgi:hypothetical protein
MRPHLREFRFQKISAVPTADQVLENEFVAGWANYLVIRGLRFLNGHWRPGCKYVAASWTHCDGLEQECLARGARNDLV